MIFILNEQQETIGVASNSNPRSLPYFNDLHTENLEGVNTYEFSVPNDHEDSAKIQVEGFVIISNLDGEQILFTIKEVNEGNDNGKRIKQVFCEETAISELLTDVVRPAKYLSTTLSSVLTTVLGYSYGWTLKNVPYTVSQDVVFEDYTTVLEAVKAIASTFGVEIYFTVNLEGTKITKKYVNVVEQRGEDAKIRFDYSYDLTGVSRTENSSDVVTALIGIGKGDNSSQRVNLTTFAPFTEGDFYKEDGADWIGSESALQRWGRNGRHRFAVFVDDTATNQGELKRSTLRELKKRVQPVVHYGCSVKTLERLSGYEAKRVRLGDTTVINDKTYETPMVVSGRVVQLKRSYTRVDADEVELGNYKPVTLSVNKTILDLQKKISLNEEKWNVSGMSVEIQSPNGNTFKNGTGATVLTAKTFKSGLEVDTSGELYTYKWYKFNANGDLITLWGGSTDYRTGKTLPVTDLDVEVSATFLVTIDGVGQSQFTVFEVYDGEAGSSGTTYYTWVKYADTEAGVGMSDDPTGKRFLGIAYNKTTSVKGTNPADYSWSPLYDNVKVGGRNLLLDTSNEDKAFDFTGDRFVGEAITPYGLSELSKGGTFAVSADITTHTVGSTKVGVMIHLNKADGSYTQVTDVNKALNALQTGGIRSILNVPAGAYTSGYLYLHHYASTDPQSVGTYARAKIEAGNITTDWSPSPEDIRTGLDSIGVQVTDLVDTVQPAKIVEAIKTEPDFTSIFSDYATTESLNGVASALEDTREEVIGYVDTQIGLQDDKILEVSSNLTQTANSINAKFSSSGGINLIRNSLGFAGWDFWDVRSGTLTILQNKDLEELGFGSGFSSTVGQAGYIEQTVYVTPDKSHTLSFWMRKILDNATNGWAGVDLYEGSTKLAFIGKAQGSGVTDSWDLGLYTFTPTTNQVTIRITIGAGADATISGLMLNVGENALQWQHANGEVYNTNIQMNLNGIKVINKVTNGYTIMSPQEFSGYAEVADEVTGAVSTQRVFTLNGDTTEVTKLDADNEIRMGNIKIVPTNTAGRKGWAFISTI